MYDKLLKFHRQNKIFKKDAKEFYRDCVKNKNEEAPKAEGMEEF